jgi:hypothetical protein
MHAAESPAGHAPGSWTLAALAACVCALALSSGTLHAPLVSEDSAALGYVLRHGPWADLWQAQYDLRTVRFWRPWVTASLGLQQQWTGVDPLFLRGFNWLCHGASAALVVAVARAARWPLAAGLFAGLWAATFPYQGGTVTWVVGRVDSQVLPALLGTVWAALRGRPGWAAVGTVLALGTKESGVVAPFVAACLCLARGDSWRSLVRNLGPATLALAGALAWRAWAIGDLVGGYATGPGAEPAPIQGERLLAGFASLGAALAPSLGGGAALLVLAVLRGSLARRPLVWVLGAAAGCLLPLVPLLGTIGLGLEHRRWLLAFDLFLGLALAAALGPGWVAGATGPRARTAAAALIGVLGLVLVGQRGIAARADVRLWAAAGERAAEHEAEIRAALAGEAPDPRPVLVPGLPRLTADGRAYVLHWGVADRFRPPFPPAPRPVWPWRPLFAVGEGPLEPAVELRAGLLSPPPLGTRRVPELTLRVRPAGAAHGRPEHGLPEHGPPEQGFDLDAGLLTDAAPGAGAELWLPAELPGTALEFALYTELGYGTARGALPGSVETLEAGPQPILGRRMSLREVLLSARPGGLPLHAVLAQAADLGAGQTWLELRVLDEGGGGATVLRASSDWIPLRLSAELRELLLPR